MYSLSSHTILLLLHTTKYQYITCLGWFSLIMVQSIIFFSIKPVKQISFQDSWVNTQAFLINWVLAFSIGYHFFWYLGAFLVIGYFLKTNDYLRSNHFLCLSVSIFVYITVIVSTQARYVNTWWAQTLVKTWVCLSAPGIFYSCYCLQSAMETSLSILRTFTRLPEGAIGVCVLSNALLLFHLQDQR